MIEKFLEYFHISFHGESILYKGTFCDICDDICPIRTVIADGVGGYRHPSPPLKLNLLPPLRRAHLATDCCSATVPQRCVQSTGQAAPTVHSS